MRPTPLAAILLVALLLSIYFLPAFPRRTPKVRAWLGKNVFLKEDAQPRMGDQAVPRMLIPFPAEVEGVVGERLRLGAAWVHQSEVMDVDEALSKYQDEVREDPDSAAARHRLAAAWKEIGVLDLAIHEYGRSIRLDGEAAVVYYGRAGAWLAKDDFDAAIKDCTEAVRIEPTFAKAYVLRGLAWSEKEDFTNAIQDYTEAIRLDPNDAAAHNNRGVDWKDMGDFEAAIQDFTEAIRLDPRDARAYDNRGDAWSEKGDFDAATKDYSEAIRLDPKFAMAYNDRAWLRATAADPKHRDGASAVKDAEKACELSGWKDPHRLDTLAAAYAEAGNFAKAVETQERALSMPTSAAKKADFRERLALYRDKQPYREPVKAKP